MNQPHVARQYEALLVHFSHLTIVDVTRDVARRAALLRATYNIQSPDAILITTAVIGGATAFITNDKKL